MPRQTEDEWQAFGGSRLLMSSSRAGAHKCILSCHLFVKTRFSSFYRVADCMASNVRHHVCLIDI